MRLALLSPVHGTSIEHIARQLDNYRVFLAPFQLRHYCIFRWKAVRH